MQKKKDEKDDREDQKNEIMAKILSKEALDRLQRLDLEKPETAEKCKAALYKSWLMEQFKNGPVSDGYLLNLIGELNSQAEASRGVQLDRRRFGDDSDDDIDLDGL